MPTCLRSVHLHRLLGGRSLVVQLSSARRRGSSEGFERGNEERLEGMKGEKSLGTKKNGCRRSKMASEWVRWIDMNGFARFCEETRVSKKSCSNSSHRSPNSHSSCNVPAPTRLLGAPPRPSSSDRSSRFDSPKVSFFLLSLCLPLFSPFFLSSP